MGQIIFFACRQWKEEIRKTDFWAAIICEAVFFSIFFIGAGDRLGEAGETVGICSVLPVSLLDMDFVLVILSGYIMAVSGIFPAGKNTGMLAMRADRMRWYLGQVFYCVLASITYFAAVTALQLSFYAGHIGAGTGWGSGVAGGTAFSGRFVLEVPQTLLMQDAMQTFLCAFAFSALLGIFFGMVCCVCSMYSRSGAGTAICAGLVVLERIRATGGADFGVPSPVGMLANYLGMQPGDAVMTAAYYIFLTGILISLGMYRIRRMDMG